MEQGFFVCASLSAHARAHTNALLAPSRRAPQIIATVSVTQEKLHSVEAQEGLITVAEAGVPMDGLRRTQEVWGCGWGARKKREEPHRD